MTPRYLPIAILCAFLIFALPAAAEKRTGLRIAMTQFPSTFHPAIDSMLAKTYVLGMTRRPLTVYDARWKLVCLLCTELPSYENGRIVTEDRPGGKRGLAVTYTIKPQARWGDGRPVTTRDILFSWEAGKHPETGYSNFELYARDIVGITAVDEKTFTVHLEKVVCDPAGLNDFEVLPEHLERDVFESDPAAYRNRTLYDRAPENPGLYFGPYVISRVDAGSAVTLAPNPYWWGKKPYFNKISIRTIENTTALGASLLSGDIDYIAGELGLTTDQALAFEKRLNRKYPGAYNVVFKPGLVYEHIDINQDNPKLADPRLRQALLYAMDRNALSQQLFEGRQAVAHSAVNPLDGVYFQEVKKYPYDPQAAAALLDAAGWMLREDGQRYNGKGEKLSVTLMTTAGDRTREIVEQAVQSDWRKAGIETVIKNEPARVLFGRTLHQRKFSDLVMYAWFSSPANVPRTTLHSSMIPSDSNGWAGQNYTGYKNAEMDEILDDLETVCEPEKNRALWNRLQQIYSEDLPALPLYYRANAYFIPAWLKGIEPTGHQYLSSYWVENWSAK